MRCLHHGPDVPARQGFFRLPFVAAAAALCVFASAASAQEALLAQASARLGERDAAGAYALLAPAEAAHAGTPRFDYLLGIAALDAGHVTRAIFALERVVQAQPDDRLAHAELGRAYLAAGDAAAARAHLRQARGDGAPAEASAAIDRVLGVIDRVAPQPGPRVAGYIEFGGGHDSNVNSATNQGEFTIPGFGGILFQTSPENRRRSDLVGTSAAGLNGELALAPGWALVAAANLRAALNRHVHDLNTVLLDTSLGARHTAGSHSQTVALQSGVAWVGAARYRTANGLTAQWQSQFGPTAQASVFGQWSRQNHPRQAERDNDRSLAGIGFARAFPSIGTLAYGSVYAARERTDDDAFAHHGHRAAGLRLGAEHRFTSTVTAFVEGQHERRRHGGAEPVFDAQREDRQTDVAAGVRHRPAEHWEVVAQARRTRAASNVVLYDHTRNLFQLTVRRNFP